MTKKVKKEKSVLDQVKKLERFKKAQILAETIEGIKIQAKEVLLIKEETKLLLEEIGISEKDIKAVIDYVNSIVKLTKADKDELREKVRETKKKREEEVAKKMKKQPYPIVSKAFGVYTDTMYATSDDTTYDISLGNTGYNIKV